MCPPEREGERTLGMRLEQTETETHVLYDKKTKEKARKRKSWWGSQNQSINQSINQEVFVLQNLMDKYYFDIG